ncbi:MAG: alpha/beta fold hydrolase, partial [Myxococcales bacterium]|nr:alpha/beta fold hydrolase [Myxococcales bacterium]
MARPLLIPALERLGKVALGRRGVVSKDVDTPLGRVHTYEVKGRGELAQTCILHGYGSAATAFGPLILRLARHSRGVIAPELPGHGFSEIPGARLDTEGLFAAMRHALDELLPEPSIVLGNSLGGAVALRYAIERPERVKALVLVSPAGAPMED